MQKLNKFEITVSNLSKSCFHSILIPISEKNEKIEGCAVIAIDSTMFLSMIRAISMHLGIADLYHDVKHDQSGMISVLFSFAQSITISNVELNDKNELIFTIVIIEE